MSSGNVGFKRVGSPKAISKDESTGYLIVSVSLDGTPDWNWIECFKHPSTFTTSEAYPGRAFVTGNTITFSSSERTIKENVEWMDKYIQQANECYSRKMAEQVAEEKRQEERERKRKEELERINEGLKDL
jgi:hypothetical protein